MIWREISGSMKPEKKRIILIDGDKVIRSIDIVAQPMQQSGRSLSRLGERNLHRVKQANYF